MRSFFLRRLAVLIPTVLGAITLVFFFLHMIPGDPVEVMLGETAQQADKERLREELGLNLPLHVQYGNFLIKIAQGDLGESYFYRRPVAHVIAERIPATMELALVAFVVAGLIAIPLGIIAALREGTTVDNLSVLFSLVGVSMPNFWLGPLLIILFSLKLGWFPVSGRTGVASLVLPAVTLGIGLAALLSRMTRASLLERLGEDYLTVARAKGLPEWKVILKHALRNALIPIITVMGLQIGVLLSGAIITENVFAWPGIGTLLINAIEARDYPVVQGCVLLISLSYVVVNLITDLVYGWADPRIRLRG
ncbi:MAG: glutathione ABC transporter permease GsiC [Deltaproteobacteria bacterium RBG_16_54_18]|jgi:peptide/nickel transport system permease protein|nr:MAG: glutathione ABC transporter permease GsiC [Deltaproteobacteria bacterium RBG_16_54_18]